MIVMDKVPSAVCIAPKRDFLAGFSEFAAAFKQRNIGGWLLFFAAVAAVVAVKVVTMKGFDNNIFFGGYSLLVCIYILSRFLLAYFYKPNLSNASGRGTPTVSFGVPSKNEGEHIRE